MLHKLRNGHCFKVHSNDKAGLGMHWYASSAIKPATSWTIVVTPDIVSRRARPGLVY
jgi:hypothetical protein